MFVEPRRLGFIAVHIETFSEGNERLVLNQVFTKLMHSICDGRGLNNSAWCIRPHMLEWMHVECAHRQVSQVVKMVTL